MKYCPKCGAELVDAAQVCYTCGCSQPPASITNDAKSFGFALLGFFIPVAGLVLYLVWKDTMPRKAKSAGKGALTSVILTVIFYLLIMALSLLNIISSMDGF